MTAAAPFDADYRLEDRYARERGRVYLTGVQALVRLPLMQRRRDLAAGLSTAGFISGYRGSPLGTYDLALWQAKDQLESHHVRFSPGVNEDLAATAVWGSQQAGLYQGPRYDGVFAIWYGKGPGVDRSCDALKHGNYAGAAPQGGVLVLAGDDPGAKSSSIAHQSEPALVHCGIPILNPADVQEYLDFGLQGFALSRYSGSWIAMKCLTDTVDSARSVSVDPGRVQIVAPGDFERPEGLHIGWQNLPLAVERRLYQQRLPAVQAFVRSNKLDRLVFPGSRRRARDRHHRQGASRSAASARGARDRRGSGQRDRALDLQGGDVLAARAGGHAPLRGRTRGRAGGRGEAAADRRAAGAAALQLTGPAAALGQDGRAGRAAGAFGGGAESAGRRAGAAQLARAPGSRAGDGAGRAQLRLRGAAERGRAREAAELLLRLPPQHLDRGSRREHRAGRDRLSWHGRLAPGSPHARGDPDGRGGRQLDRRRALHRDRACLPEYWRWHLFPFRPARGPRRGRRLGAHHVQGPGQRRGRHDRGPADRGRAAAGRDHGSRDRAPARRGGRAPDRRRQRGPEEVSERRALPAGRHASITATSSTACSASCGSGRVSRRSSTTRPARPRRAVCASGAAIRIPTGAS